MGHKLLDRVPVLLIDALSWERTCKEAGYQPVSSDLGGWRQAHREAPPFLLAAYANHTYDEQNSLVPDETGLNVVVEAAFPNLADFRFRLYETTYMGELSTWSGLAQDVSMGHEDLDIRFIVKGNDVPRVQRLLHGAAVHERLAALPLSVDLRVERRRRTLSRMRWPQHVSSFVLRVNTHGLSLAPVPKATALMDLLFPRLVREPEEQTARIDFHGNRVAGLTTTSHGAFYDGGRIRQASAWALGQLGTKAAITRLVPALLDVDQTLADTAAASLKTIGGPEVIEAVLPLLGRHWQGPVGHEWKRLEGILVYLGEAELVNAFQGLLDGSESALDALTDTYEEATVLALRRVIVGSWSSPAIVAAARALGDLGVRESLREIQRALRRTQLDETQRAAVEDVVARLRDLQALPRPATTTREERLPRPAAENRKKGQLPRVPEDD